MASSMRGDKVDHRCDLFSLGRVLSPVHRATTVWGIDTYSMLTSLGGRARTAGPVQLGSAASSIRPDRETAGEEAGGAGAMALEVAEALTALEGSAGDFGRLAQAHARCPNRRRPPEAAGWPVGIAAGLLLAAFAGFFAANILLRQELTNKPI
jgi:hypothetical protein